MTLLKPGFMLQYGDDGVSHTKIAAVEKGNRDSSKHAHTSYIIVYNSHFQSNVFPLQPSNLIKVSPTKFHTPSYF